MEKRPSELIAVALDDFTSLAKELRSQAVDDPARFAHPGAYFARADTLVQPLVIRTTENNVPGVTQPVANVRYVNREVWTRFFYEVSPAIFKALPPQLPSEHALHRAWLIGRAARVIERVQGRS